MADTQSFDVVVLGAGMVGVSTALHLAIKGRRVALVDRRGPGEETSYGNTGVIDGGNVLPLGMPRSLSVLARHALNREIATHYHPGHIVKAAPFLFAYWRNSAPDILEKIGMEMRPFFAASVAAHRELATLAKAERFFRRDGWLKLFRSPRTLDGQARELALARELGLDNRLISAGELAELEPHLKPNFAGAIWARDAETVSSPGGVTKAYAEAFAAAGGTILIGDAMTLAPIEAGYCVETGEGRLAASQAVVALGPWSNDLLARFGYVTPLSVKRGYHRHFAIKGNATLMRPVVDEDLGFCLTPMDQGTRLTTGAEFADRDALKTPVQMARATRAAETVFDLGEPVEVDPWMGRRPMMPDSKPVVGRAPRHQNLWLAFGHGHWGFTLGPITGKTLAATIVGEEVGDALAPYRLERFG